MPLFAHLRNLTTNLPHVKSIITSKVIEAAGKSDFNSPEYQKAYRDLSDITTFAQQGLQLMVVVNYADTFFEAFESIRRDPANGGLITKDQLLQLQARFEKSNKDIAKSKQDAETALIYIDEYLKYIVLNERCMEKEDKSVHDWISSIFAQYSTENVTDHDAAADILYDTQQAVSAAPFSGEVDSSIHNDQ